MRQGWSYLDTKLDMASVSTHTSDLGGTPSLITQTQAVHPTFTSQT